MWIGKRGCGCAFQWHQYLFPIRLQGSGRDLGCNLVWCLRRLLDLAVFKTVLGNIWGMLKRRDTIWVTVSRRELQGSLLLFRGDQSSHGAHFFADPMPIAQVLGVYWETSTLV